MSLLDDINLYLRDFEGYTGDGQGGRGALPVGDRATARKQINLRDLRELLRLIAQSMGDPGALQDILDELGDKADQATVAALQAVVAAKADLAKVNQSPVFYLRPVPDAPIPTFEKLGAWEGDSMQGRILSAIWPTTNSEPAPICEISGGLYEILGQQGQTLDAGELRAGVIVMRVTTTPSGESPGTARLLYSTRASQVGLGNVDNTADADKPLSGPQAEAIAAALSGINWPVDLPDHRVDAHIAVGGGVVRYDGKSSPNAEGFVIPAGVAGGNATFFNLTQFPEAPDLAGRTVRFTAIYDASPDLVGQITRSGARFRTARNGTSSANRPVVRDDMRQSGSTVIFEVDYVVDATDEKWGHTLQMSDFGPAVGVDRSIRLVGLAMEVLTDTEDESRLAYNIHRLIEAQRSDHPMIQDQDMGAVPRITCDQTSPEYDLGFSITTPAITVSGAASPVSLPEQSWTVPAPETEDVTNHAFTLVYSTATSVPGQRLPHQYITDPVVTRVSDSAVLVRGVDYQITPDRCYIYGLQDIENTPCQISYEGHLHRYDLISINMATGALVRTAGTERPIDPEEYKPSIPAGHLLLWTIYVNRHGCDLLPSWRHVGGFDSLGAAAHANWLSWSRSCLPGLTRKLRRGDPIKVASYGSSSLAMQAVSVPSRTEWGGNRDAKSFWDRIPLDTRAQYPIYDNTDPDFAVNGGTVPKTKQGIAWGLIDGLREKWGADVVYHNWAIGGTNATATGGLDPEWLNAVIADDPDVVLLGFANGIGASWQYDNNRQIIEAMQAAGIEVIVLSTPALNAYGTPNPANWQRTHDDLVRAALDTGSAYVSTLSIDGPGREAFLSPKSMGNGNLFNHGGPAQYATMRRMLWELVP